MFCRVQEYVHGMEKVSPNLQGKVYPGHPCRIFYTEDPSLQGLHTVGFPESMVRPTLRTNPHIVPIWQISLDSNPFLMISSHGTRDKTLPLGTSVFLICKLGCSYFPCRFL